MTIWNGHLEASFHNINKWRQDRLGQIKATWVQLNNCIIGFRLPIRVLWNILFAPSCREEKNWQGYALCGDYCLPSLLDFPPDLAEVSLSSLNLYADDSHMLKYISESMNAVQICLHLYPIICNVLKTISFSSSYLVHLFPGDESKISAKVSSWIMSERCWTR